jgi:hypothetical protein
MERETLIAGKEDQGSDIVGGFGINDGAGADLQDAGVGAVEGESKVIDEDFALGETG